MDPETADVLFFGRETKAGQHRYTAGQVARARAICERCPVLFECLEDCLRAPQRHDRYGIRAGLLPSERASLRDDPGPRTEADPWIGGPVEGTLRQRPQRRNGIRQAESGRWQARFYIGSIQDGTQFCATFDTREEAEAWRDAVRDAHRNEHGERLPIEAP